MNKKNALIGTHLSIAGGLPNAILKAKELDIDCFQIFVGNNRQWKTTKRTPQELTKFKLDIKNSDIKSVIAHATYLINLCSHNEDVKIKSHIALTEELNICSELDIPYLVLHPGSNKNTYTQSKDIASAINKIYKDPKITTMLLLETMSGQGNCAGSSFTSLKEIYENILIKDKIGFCFDTCHIFASGYDITSEAKIKNVLQEFDSVLGLEKIKSFHINDSKKELGTKLDRHEHIGRGKIGLEAFKYILNEPAFQNIPKILETPINNESDILTNLKTLYSLI
jgi:deoxyribonuclease IV